MSGDEVEVEGGHGSGITIFAMAEKRPGKLTPKQLGEIAEAELRGWNLQFSGARSPSEVVYGAGY